jgi:hypothetical protein
MMNVFNKRNGHGARHLFQQLFSAGVRVWRDGGGILLSATRLQGLLFLAHLNK